MTKSNPLFIDSTKFHGDLIQAQIELKRVFVREGEDVFVIASTEKTGARRLNMRVTEDGSFEARVNLHHQTPVSYQFFIEKDGQLITRSVLHHGRASYVIIEDWQPALSDDMDVLVETNVVRSAAESPPEASAPGAPGKAPSRPARANGASWAKDSSMSVRSLIEKYGL